MSKYITSIQLEVKLTNPIAFVFAVPMLTETGQHREFNNIPSYRITNICKKQRKFF